MKTKFFSALIILSTVFVSCKKDTQTTPTEKKTEKSYFSVEVETSAKKTDDFAMYFTEDNTTNFKGENAVWHGVKGGGKLQTIEYKLSPEKVPTDFRLDFGLKKDQDSVVVKNVKVNYYDNVYEFKGSDFFNYFIKNDEFETKIDQANGTMVIFQKNGKFAAYYYPTKLTLDNIKKITTVVKK